MSGGTLLEVLIGMLVLGITCVGTTQITARVAVTQAGMNQLQFAVTQMGDLLRSGTQLCNGNAAILNINDFKPSIPGKNAAKLTLSVDGCGTGNRTINGVTVVGLQPTLKLTLREKSIVNGQEEERVFAEVGRQ